MLCNKLSGNIINLSEIDFNKQSKLNGGQTESEGQTNI